MIRAIGLDASLHADFDSGRYDGQPIDPKMEGGCVSG